MANPQSNVRSRGGDTMPPKSAAPASTPPSGGQLVTLVLAWLGVGLPLLWGVLQTLEKTLALFK
ncbi:MAG TPA: hypothetical protein VFS67_34725 [Polyangiaceae bacterium]|nr:hypothetical protein [Polyangiaceae bacterium]